jgi:hypothetical protein
MTDWQQMLTRARERRAQVAAQDAEEARLLRAAERLAIWRELGLADMFEYMEQTLGYPSSVANERLQLARRLGELPAVEAALGRGELTLDGVKELVRVVTPQTEWEWLHAVSGKSLRLIRALLRGKLRGDRPGDTARELAEPW